MGESEGHVLSGHDELGELAKDKDAPGVERHEGDAGGRGTVAEAPAIPAYDSGGAFIGKVPHIQAGFHGSSVDRWEREHGIQRYVMNGVEYVRCQDFKRFREQTAAEEETQRQERLKKKIAEQQARAYFGTEG